MMNILRDIARKLGLRGSRRWFRKKVNAVRRQRVGSVSLRVPRIWGLTCLESEPWMMTLLANALRHTSGLFLDVGVNVGQTLLKLKALEPAREYVGLEPNPACVFYVQQLLKANAFQNCTLLPVGLFSRDGLLTLNYYADDITDASASLIANFRPDRRVYEREFVPVIGAETLSVVLGARNIGIIKIDVEGAELEVLKALAAVIRQHQPLILIEILPVYSENNVLRKTRQIELEELIASYQYVVFRVEKTHAGEFIQITKISAIGIHSDLNQCEYVLVPQAQADAVEKSWVGK